MIFRIHKPGPPLDRLIDNLVYYQGYRPEHVRERMLPDSGVYLLIDLDDTPKNVYDNDRMLPIKSCRKSWLSGFQTGFITFDAGYDSSMLVIRMFPAGAHVLLGLPMSELSDRIIDADLVLGNSVNDLRDVILEADSPEAKFQRVEQFLLRRIGSSIGIHRAVEYAIREIEQEPCGITINRVHFETGFSRKHLSQLFSRWVGITPKKYQRIARFQRALTEIEKGDSLNWSTLALDCGYYDQAHFINDFRHFCGLTPVEYSGAKGEHLNYIPLR